MNVQNNCEWKYHHVNESANIPVTSTSDDDAASGAADRFGRLRWLWREPVVEETPPSSELWRRACFFFLGSLEFIATRRRYRCATMNNSKAFNTEQVDQVQVAAFCTSDHVIRRYPPIRQWPLIDWLTSWRRRKAPWAVLVFTRRSDDRCFGDTQIWGGDWFLLKFIPLHSLFLQKHQEK